MHYSWVILVDLTLCDNCLFNHFILLVVLSFPNPLYQLYNSPENANSSNHHFYRSCILCMYQMYCSTLNCSKTIWCIICMYGMYDNNFFDIYWIFFIRTRHILMPQIRFDNFYLYLSISNTSMWQILKKTVLLKWIHVTCCTYNVSCKTRTL